MVQMAAKAVKKAVSAAALALASSAVNAAGLTKVKTVAETFQAELSTIIPVIAVIALIIFGVGYAAKMIDKDTFVRWAVGILIAGSAVQITTLFLS